MHRRSGWGWRLAAYVALLLLLTSGLETAVVLAGLGDGEPLNPWIAGAAAAGALAASWVMMSAVESRSPAALGLVPGWRAIRDFLSGAGVGGLIVAAVCAAMFAAGWLEPQGFASRSMSADGRVLQVTVTLLFAAFFEEVAVRGYPFQVLARSMGPIGATLLTAVLFAGLHGLNPGLGFQALVNTFLAGILLGIMYWKTFSLWVVTGTHFAWNWTMGVAVGLPVSGVDLDLEAVRARVTGPASLTGGSYGPEGGWLLGLSTLTVLIWMGRTRRWSRDPAVVALEPLPCRSVPRRCPGETPSADQNSEDL